MIPLSRQISLTSLLMTLTAPASAQVPPVEVRLLPGWQEPSGSYIAALEIDLQPGWKTYWRVPGEAGIPASFDWSGSSYIEAVDIIWPAPEVFETYGYQSYGFHDHVILPLRMQLTEQAERATAHVNLEFGVCEDICIPVQQTLTLELPVQERHNVEAVQAAMDAIPLSREEAGIRMVRCYILPSETAYANIDVDVSFETLPAENPAAVVDFGLPEIYVDQADIIRNGATLHLSSAIYNYSSGSLALEWDAITVTLIYDGYAIETGC